MSCDYQLVAYVHCPPCKVICHCLALALQAKCVQMAQRQHHHYQKHQHQNQRQPMLFWSSSVKWQSCCDTNRLQCSETFPQTEISFSIQPNATLRKDDMNNPACLHACLWHKDTVVDHSFFVCVCLCMSVCVCVCVCVCEWVIQKAPSLLLRLSTVLCETRRCDSAPEAAASTHTVNSSNTTAYGGKHSLLIWHFTLTTPLYTYS